MAKNKKYIEDLRLWIKNQTFVTNEKKRIVKQLKESIKNKQKRLPFEEKEVKISIQRLNACKKTLKNYLKQK